MSVYVGHYDIGGGEMAIGELELSGDKSRLTLRSERELSPYAFASAISGKGLDGKGVTCIQCVPMGQGTDFGHDGRLYHWLSVFPHHVALGERAVDPDDAVYDAIEFTTNDLAKIAFAPASSGVSVLTPEISRNLNVDEAKAKDGGLVVYFNGPPTITDVVTTLGRVRIHHFPSGNSGDHSGISILLRVLLRIDFEKAVSLEDARKRLHVIRRFLSIVAGRNQVVTSFNLRHVDDVAVDENAQDLVASCAVSSPMSALEEVSHGALSHWDLPLHPSIRADEFSLVLRQWVNRDADRLEPRVNFHDCYISSNKYNSARLIVAANMFDLLPDEDAPKDVDVAGDLSAAVSQVREIMQALPETPQRNSILGAVGRLKKASLTAKVLHRWGVMSPVLGSVFPEMDKVLKFAVASRNHFVHGSSVKILDDDLYLSVPFLTDALEFVFVSSDLIESGWSVNGWVSRHMVNSHPMSRFRVSYTDSLARLKALGAIK